jgi:hypothetical protein
MRPTQRKRYFLLGWVAHQAFRSIKERDTETLYFVLFLIHYVFFVHNLHVFVFYFQTTYILYIDDLCRILFSLIFLFTRVYMDPWPPNPPR